MGGRTLIVVVRLSFIRKKGLGKSMDTILGIDTSNYVTSLALVDLNGELIWEGRKTLTVPEGGRGLRQSEALFQHINQLPNLLEEVRCIPTRIKAICISSRPRPVEGSYMPVFKAGISIGQSMGAVLKVPVFFTSHQEGHLKVGLWSAGGPLAEKFLGVHLSGGTSELGVVNITREGGFSFALLGGTQDLHAGQFVDRVGVNLGLCFPAGPALEKLAAEYRLTGEKEVQLSAPVKGYNWSFSGPEAHAQRMIASGVSKGAVACAVEAVISKALEKVLRKAVEETGIKDILICGGVAANSYLRQRLNKRLAHPAVGARLFFAEPRFSGDNAVGVALLGLKYLE